MRKPYPLLAVFSLGLAAVALATSNPQVNPNSPLRPKASAIPKRVLVNESVMAVAARPPIRPLTLAKIAPALLIAEGQVTAVVRLTDPPLTVAVGKNAKKLGIKITAASQRAMVAGLLKKQEPIIAEVTKGGGRVNARLTKVLNAVVVTVDATVLPILAKNASVAAIRPVADYELDLAETVPYIGAATLHTAGVDGTGIRVAVLDSGIDYTHAHLGGPGTAADYEAAYGTDVTDPLNTTRDGLFPTAKVIEGYDFVGESWPAGDLAPDDDPIDSAHNADFSGHGTHVADIIAGVNGVAPGASLYAVKVCSAIASSCSGVAVLEGLDYAADPNQDDDASDAVDVVNMSLGTSYGQIQDDSVLAVQNLVDFGVVVVISAGNDGDKPYVVGAASTAAGAISVAQTQVPSAKVFTLTLTGDGVPTPPLEIKNTASLDWAPVNADVSGDVVYVGRGCVDSDPSTAGDQTDTYPAGDLTGKVVLIDRGACNVSEKVDRAANAGAAGVIIANNVPGDPPSFSQGNGSTFVPTLVISQSNGDTIKSLLAGGVVVASFGPASFVSVVGSMVSTSSRGPDSSTQMIKPDIGAPGASVSAVVGTGTGEEAFGGTSGAAPMVSGSAALLLQAFPGLLPYEVKARLMNNAEQNILLNPVSLPGVLAPITRIGAGEVRVDRAFAATTLAYDASTLIPSLSFGYRGINGAGVVNAFKRTIAIRNLGTAACTYEVVNAFRYSDDAASGAVTVSFSPSSVNVPANGTSYVRMTLTVDGTKLPDWDAYLNGGSLGGSGEGLRKLEYDGFVTLTCDDQSVALPWQMLPRKAADVRTTSRQLKLIGDPGLETGTLTLKNPLGSMAGTTEVFDLLGTSPLDYPSPAPPGSDYTLTDLKSFGARVVQDSGQYYLQFALATYGEPAEPNYPVGLNVDIDTSGDGVADYAVYNIENGGFAATGQNITRVYNYNSDTTVTTAYTDCDLDSGVVVMTVPLSALGLPDLGYPMNIVAYAIDDYFTGFLTDVISDGPYEILYTPGVPRFYVSGAPGAFGVGVPKGGTTTLPLSHYDQGDTWSPSQQGLMLFNRQAAPQRWSDEVKLEYGPPE